jgi:hypothetical protein
VKPGDNVILRPDGDWGELIEQIDDEHWLVYNDDKDFEDAAHVRDIKPLHAGEQVSEVDFRFLLSEPNCFVCGGSFTKGESRWQRALWDTTENKQIGWWAWHTRCDEEAKRRFSEESE